jgi:hypothetical protein
MEIKKMGKSEKEKSEFIGTKEDNIATLKAIFIVIVIIAAIFIFIEKASKPVLYGAGGIIAVLWFISTLKDVKKGITNWFMVIGSAVIVVGGWLSLKSYGHLEELKDDKLAHVEKAATQIIANETGLEFDNEIDKETNNLYMNLAVAGGGLLLYCVGRIIKSNSEKKTVVIEKSVEAPVSANAVIPNNTAEKTSYIFCQNCGQKISSTAKFCKSCGTRVE